MIVRSALAAAAILMAGTPAMALQAAPAAPISEADFEVLANAFNGRMQALQTEVQGAVTAAAGDTTKLSADVDVITARYAPEIDTFAGQVESFLDGQIAAATDEAQRQQLTAARQQAGAGLRSIPQQLKAAALQAASTPATPN